MGSLMNTQFKSQEILSAPCMQPIYTVEYLMLLGLSLLYVSDKYLSPHSPRSLHI